MCSSVIFLHEACAHLDPLIILPLQDCHHVPHARVAEIELNNNNNDDEPTCRLFGHE